jgi:hypothetical protein
LGVTAGKPIEDQVSLGRSYIKIRDYRLGIWIRGFVYNRRVRLIGLFSYITVVDKRSDRGGDITIGRQGINAVEGDCNILIIRVVSFQIAEPSKNIVLINPEIRLKLLSIPRITFYYFIRRL